MWLTFQSRKCEIFTKHLTRNTLYYSKHLPKHPHTTWSSKTRWHVHTNGCLITRQGVHSVIQYMNKASFNTWTKCSVWYSTPKQYVQVACHAVTRHDETICYSTTSVHTSTSSITGDHIRTVYHPITSQYVQAACNYLDMLKLLYSITNVHTSTSPITEQYIQTHTSTSPITEQYIQTVSHQVTMNLNSPSINN